MSAAATDHLRKVAPKWVAQVGSGGITDNTGTTIPLSSVTGLPTDTAVTVTFDRVDSNGVKTPSLEETVVGVVSGSNLVNCIRGVEGTAQAHVAGAVAEVLLTSTGWNDIIDAFLVAFNQNGTIKTGTTITSGVFNGNMTGTAIKTTVTLSENSDTLLPSQKAVKTYIDSGTVTMTNKTLTTPVIGNLKGYDGWIVDTTTWTYASASTFTIAGVDATAKFLAGTRLRFKQGAGYKYAVVVSSAFSTNTTVTIAVNTDYTVANAVITDNYYSYESCPQGYPQWFAFTPAWDNLTEGSATNVGAYSLIGKTLTFRAKIVFAANTSVSGGITLTLPVTINTGYTTNCNIGIVTIADSGVGLILGKIWADGQIYADLSSGTYVTPIILSSSVPMTWTTNDTLEVVGTYQIA